MKKKTITIDWDDLAAVISDCPHHIWGDILYCIFDYALSGPSSTDYKDTVSEMATAVFGVLRNHITVQEVEINFSALPNEE